MNQIEDAKIWGFEYINETQRQHFYAIMDETKSSVKSKLDGKQQENKKVLRLQFILWVMLVRN